MGSVVDAPTASLYIQLGTNFVVSPVIKGVMATGMQCTKDFMGSGMGSLSEISRAEEFGAEIVKIFPAGSVGGPQFVSSVKGPCPWTSIMPTGGVSPTEENLTLWFNSGVACVGMGSKLITKDILAKNDYTLLQTKVNELLQLIRRIRTNI